MHRSLDFSFTVASFIFLLIATAEAHEPRIEKRFSRGRYDLYLLEGEQAKNLTRFAPWETIETHAVSPSGRWLFVHHRPNGKKTHLLTSYDLQSALPLGSIRPGRGGSFAWTPGETILRYSGCGSSCATIDIYDPRLKSVFSGMASGFSVSPAKDVMVLYPTTGPERDEPAQVVDTRAGKRLFARRTGGRVCHSAEFREEGSVVLECESVGGGSSAAGASRTELEIRYRKP